MNKTVGGLDENVGGALTYAFGWITGAVFLLLEPTNKFVRFHAWQSVIVFGGLSIAWFVALSLLFPLGWFIAVTNGNCFRSGGPRRAPRRAGS